MVAAATGCDVIVNGLNPPNYRDWETIIPRITREVLQAAQSSGAAVLLPGNVYHFGDRPGVWSEDTVANPVSRKGEIRLAMEHGYAKSGVQTIVLRAGNFIDPDRQGDIMSEVYLRNVRNNRITLPGPADTRQAMCFLPDWARAAVAFAEMRQELPQFEDIPFPGHTVTALEIKAGVERVLQRKLKFVRFPWWALNIASPFWERSREIREMRYLWNTDHALSDRRFRQLLPSFEATPLEDVFRKVLAEVAVSERSTGRAQIA
ncbi:epimerase [uncultured Roseobacter sp.]|uniref:epimerase n=1 Tax=uncultured Roseobacter sp. TaxID=114847 RepID=UPI00262D1646|nr:epimerase [uncultured Roseobacter sp.]